MLCIIFAILRLSDWTWLCQNRLKLGTFLFWHRVPMCCLCNRHEFPVCSFTVLSLKTVRLLPPLQILIKCCKAPLFYVSCIIHCEVRLIALTALATTLEQMWANSIFKSSLLLCAQIIILWITELQYAWILSCPLCQTSWNKHTTRNCRCGWTMRRRCWKGQICCIRASHCTLPVAEGLLCLPYMDKFLGLGLFGWDCWGSRNPLLGSPNSNSFTPCGCCCIDSLKNVGHLIHPPLKAFPYQQHNRLLSFHSFLHEYRIGKNKQYSHFEEICVGITSQTSNEQSQICLVRLCLVCKLCQKIFLYKWFLIVSIVVWGFASSISTYKQVWLARG